MKKLITILLLISILVLSGCGEDGTIDQDNTNTDSSGKSINQDFSIEVPDGWQENQVSSSVFMYMVSGKVDPKEGIESMNILITPAPSDLEIDFKKTMQDTLKKIPNFIIIEDSTSINIGSTKGLKMKYEIDITDQKMQYTQILLNKFDNLYTITYSCIGKECQHEDDFNDMMDSFEPIQS
tara:strand:- start:94 stop:636 length:543 start_codon:yes stop_codon:yes gene_type:complete